jgi:hypothetical protein
MKKRHVRSSYRYGCSNGGMVEDDRRGRVKPALIDSMDRFFFVRVSPGGTDEESLHRK